MNLGPQDKITQKLKLLFVFDKMEIPLTNKNVVEICTSLNDWFTYFDCMESLEELIKSGFIFKNVVEGEETRYSITYEGRSCLAHFYHKVPQHIREEIAEFSTENKMNFKRSQEYVAEYYKNEDGTHTVYFKIKEPLVQQALLEIKVKTPTRQSALDACEKWRTKAPNVYEFLYNEFLEENDDNN